MYMLYSNCLNIVQSFIAQGKLSAAARACSSSTHRGRGRRRAVLSASGCRCSRLVRPRRTRPRVKTLNRYIGREVLYATILLIFVALLMLFAFFDLIHELGDVGRDGYTLRAARCCSSA